MGEIERPGARGAAPDRAVLNLVRPDGVGRRDGDAKSLLALKSDGDGRPARRVDQRRLRRRGAQN